MAYTSFSLDHVTTEELKAIAKRLHSATRDQDTIRQVLTNPERVFIFFRTRLEPPGYWRGMHHGDPRGVSISPENLDDWQRGHR